MITEALLASGLSGGLYRAKIFDRFAFFTCNKLQFKRSSWTQRHPYGEAFLLSCTLAQTCFTRRYYIQRAHLIRVHLILYILQQEQQYYKKTAKFHQILLRWKIYWAQLYLLSGHSDGFKIWMHPLSHHFLFELPCLVPQKAF